MGGKHILALFGILLVTLSGCSLFVAQPPTAAGTVCVDKEKLTAVLTSLNLSVDDLAGGKNVSSTPTGAVIEPPTGNRTEPTPVEQPVQKPNVTEPSTPPADNVPVKRFAEGELVKLAPKASDAEGDKITFTYSDPFNAKGEWQTKAGDAGEYLVTVTASDGKSTISKQVKVIITAKNQAPVITPPADITVSEGEMISITPQVKDPDGDDVVVSYSGFMNQSVYVTKPGDAGEHFITIVASDGTGEAKAVVKVTVTKKNQAPVIEKLSSITVNEGDVVTVKPVAADPDGDKITFSFSEPVGTDGTWKTTAGDAGTYLVTVTATDGKDETKQTLTVVVESKNSPPVITLDDLTVNVTTGETARVILSPQVLDKDGDKVDITFSGWMDSSTKDVTAADAGKHQVTVTATDGKSEASKVITVTVVVNTPPSFDFG
jgi:VCBS repeat-containing protein